MSPQATYRPVQSLTSDLARREASARLQCAFSFAFHFFYLNNNRGDVSLEAAMNKTVSACLSDRLSGEKKEEEEEREVKEKWVGISPSTTSSFSPFTSSCSSVASFQSSSLLPPPPRRVTKVTGIMRESRFTYPTIISTLPQFHLQVKL